MKTVSAIVLTGGNEGDTAALLERACTLLGERAGEIAARSAVYRSAAWGFRGADFLNQALEIRTTLGAEALLDVVQGVERELGRDREREREEKARTGERYASRPVDIDILLYGDDVVDTPRLTVPHPRIAEREFVLTPLAEIAGDRPVPTTGCTAGELAERFQNKTPADGERRIPTTGCTAGELAK